MESILVNLFSLLTGLQVTVPMKQIILLVAISIFFILLGRLKSALTVNFLFIFYWTCVVGKSFSGNFDVNNIIPMASSYTVIASVIFFGIALMIFYAISE